ncbi:hypothetical protein F5Y00DRAFT_249822 [Daldinia vernicosa]|uniref:uncharacterized protein n=1 Tax=Daldinia vernicosa TaxID=114800 RepID=UPI002007B0C5|nr:uncharacterized protein F5Y00DRAFT_249822 [Daldinia vernicosa]KAI0843968.1 hypothetical protein F5Y00DRAFT_249822 [Daldinia vernicosa]
MKLLRLGLVASSVGLPFAFGAIRRDLNKRNVEIAQIDHDSRIDQRSQEILFKEADSDFEDVFRCVGGTGKRLTFDADQVFVACCAPGQRLLGSPDTAFDCCAEGHDLVGSDHTGYRCCPIGQSYDGIRCGWVCSNGKVMVDGQCVCPLGTSPAADGGCRGPIGCDSGITTGKCYVFRMENGHTLGYDSIQLHYSAADHSSQHRIGRFKICGNEACTIGRAVNPNDPVHIKDVQGTAHQSSESQGSQWLNGASDGNHIGRTPLYGDSGVFTLTKWSCGKYCLGGFGKGISYAFPSETPSITFTLDRQACTPIEIIEVPCDIHKVENNCMWEKVPGSCGPGDSNSCRCSKT